MSFFEKMIPGKAGETAATAKPTDGNVVGSRQRHYTARPLSNHLMRSFSGSYCVDCNEDNEDRHQYFLQYDFAHLRRQKTPASPFVMAPMMTIEDNESSIHISPTNNGSEEASIETIIVEYMTACRFYGAGDRINAGVLTTLRFSLPSMRVSGGFHDADMLALVEVLLRHINGPLSFIHRLDFSLGSREGYLHGRTGFRSHGALALAKVLQISKYVKEVNLQRNQIGSYGAAALFLACAQNATIEKLVLRSCRIGARGATSFAEMILNRSEWTSGSQCGLREVDLSANFMGSRGILRIEEALCKHAIKSERKSKDRVTAAAKHLPYPITVDMEGNMVFPEVMNGITHGLGMALSLVGWQLLSKRTQGMGAEHTVSCAVFSASLLVLYLSSTLYHSLFALRNIKWIFQVMDKCAIYILISGSYTPFLRISLGFDKIYSVYLLSFFWVCCFLGIVVEAFFATWKYRPLFSMIMYLSMGWISAFVLPGVMHLFPFDGVLLVVLGGVAYTVGVPFFVRNNNLDHAIWHMFVLAGSFCHWLVIYIYVARMPLDHHLSSQSE